MIDNVLTANFDNLFTLNTCSKLGQNIYGQYYLDHNSIIIKTYYGIPEHHYINFKLQFVAIDQWVNEGFTVEIETIENPDKRNFKEDPQPYRK